MFRKVILVGGFISKAKDGGVAFCLEAVKGLPQPVRMLECLFGLEDDLFENSLKKDIELFHKNLPSIPISFIVAEKQNFVEQIKSADVIYFRGGDTQRLYNSLQSIQGWQKALYGKTVIGSSAGAYILSNFYLSPGPPPELKKGFGLIPVQVVAHYHSDFINTNEIDLAQYWETVDRMVMENQRRNISIVKLREGEFLVFASSY